MHYYIYFFSTTSQTGKINTYYVFFFTIVWTDKQLHIIFPEPSVIEC